MLSAQTYFTRVIFLIVLGSPAFPCQTLHAQDASPGASQPPPIVFSKVVLLPDITEREDFFGRRIYSGTVAV